MKLIADTNILLRAFVEDDPGQSRLAQSLLDQADEIALSTTVLCELAWVMTRTYRFPRADVARAIRRLTLTADITMDRAPVEAGLAVMDAGGDFADGVIAHEGRSLGGEVFVSFDRKAVGLLHAQGIKAQLPG